MFSFSWGGIREAYIANFSDVTGITASDDLITSIDTIRDEDDGPVFKKFEFRKNTGSFTTTVTKDEATGTTYYSTEIILQFLRQETEKRIQIAALAVGDVRLIVLDSNGHYWFFGYNEPVTMSTGTAETGTAKGDFNGYNIALIDESCVMPYPVDSSVIEELLAPAEA